MKIAVLADIHGNLPALKTVLANIDSWQPDVVVTAGDIVNRGPRPKECLELILERQERDGWLSVRGNHEDYVIDQKQPDKPHSGPEYEIFLNGLWTYHQLDGQVKVLEEMPFQLTVSLSQTEEVRIVHASMLGNRAGIYPDTSPADLRQKIAPPPSVFVAGHTHRPLIRQLDNTLVVNVGSVGMPFDGDDRAAYGRLTKDRNGWQAEIVRLAYDKKQTEKDFVEAGFIPNAGDLARIMLVELRQARSHIFAWVNQYQAAVLAGHLPIAEAVDAYLAAIE